MNATPMESCKFCAVAAGREPTHLVAEGNEWLAILDRRPLFPGHTLVIPRRHFPTVADLPDELLPELFLAVRELAVAVEKAMNAEGSFVAMNNRVSQSVPHLHVHIVPRRRHDGLKGFFWPRQAYVDEASMAEVAAMIRSTWMELLRDEGVKDSNG